MTSRTALRLRKGGPAKIRTIGKVKYILGANGDMQEIRPPVLTAAGATVLKRFAKVLVYAHVTNVLDAKRKAARYFRLTVLPGYRP